MTISYESLPVLYKLRDAERAKAGYRTFTPLPHQKPPPGDWWGWLLMAGRNAGKTDAASAWVKAHVDGPACIPGPIPHRMALIAPTIGDAAQTAWHHPSSYRVHDPAGRLRTQAGGTYFQWPNGSESKLFGTMNREDVERLRAGGNLCAAHLEEFAAWRKLEDAWDQLRFALRTGPHPQWVASTTPKPRKLLVKIKNRPDVVTTQASLADNPHAPASFVREIYADYEGTRLGRQEIHGELLEKIEGALWDQEWIDLDRITDPDMIDTLRYKRVLVGVDPAGGGTEIGIVPAALIVGCPCGNGAAIPHFAVLDDFTAEAGTSPLSWAKRVGVAFDKHAGDKVAAERNYGGDMVKSNLHSARPDLPVEMVNATRGKTVRAEPIAALYEAHRVHHVGVFPRMEDEMTTWTQEEDWSPNRIDALVWALTGLKQRARSSSVRLGGVSGRLPDKLG